METNVNYTIVGAFVILLVASVIFGIIWLSAGLTVAEYDTYKVNMKESVSGLSLDSVVEYNGVNVGAVKSIELNHANPQLVELLLNIKHGTPITEGTTATLNVKGLTGIAYIALGDKGTDTTPLRAAQGEPYPVINTAPSLFLRLDTSLTNLTDSLHTVSDSIQSFLDKDNLNAIKQILANLHKFTNLLAADTKQFNIILNNTAMMSEKFLPVLQNGFGAMQALETQTLPVANQFLTNLNVMTNNLSAITMDIKQNPTVIIRGKAQPQLGPGEE